MTFVAPATASNPLLEIKNMSVDYYAANGTVHALTEVSFTLERGQILGLAGESGCGKSTLAYAIARLLRPPAYITGGQILYYPRVRGETGTSLMVSAPLAKEKKRTPSVEETP